jgi:hypothetical protein
VEEQPRRELREEERRLLRHRLPGVREARDLLDRDGLQQERGRRLALIDRGDRLFGRRGVGDALRCERLDDSRPEVVVGRDARVGPIPVERDAVAGFLDTLAGDVAQLLHDPVRGEDLEPGGARRDQDRECVRRLRVLRTVGDRGFVTVVPVRDQERHVDRQLARGVRPHACAHTAFGDVDRRLAGRPREDRVRVVEEEDRLELRARGAQEPQPLLLRPGMGALVRQHVTLLVRRRRNRRCHAFARTCDAVRADVVLGDPPVALALRHEDTLGAPGREVAACLLRRFRQGQVHDVVRAPRQIPGPLGVRDHVVRWRDERLELAGDGHVVPKRAERPDPRHSGRLDGMSGATVRTLEQAAAWVDEVGLALLFPKADVVLPSLWAEVNGSPERNWAVRDADGTFRQWTEEMGFLWGAKDELPAQGLVCVGKHLARVASCVAPRLLPMLVAANGDVAPDADPVAEAIREQGPLTGPQLRQATGLAKKEVDRRIASLHRTLVLTSSHLVREDGPWGALAHDLLARKWRLPGRLPSRERARRELAELVLERAGELTAADLSGALGWRRTEAATVLEEVGDGRDAEGFRIWTRR